MPEAIEYTPTESLAARLRRAELSGAILSVSFVWAMVARYVMFAYLGTGSGPPFSFVAQSASRSAREFVEAVGPMAIFVLALSALLQEVTADWPKSARFKWLLTVVFLAAPFWTAGQSDALAFLAGTGLVLWFWPGFGESTLGVLGLAISVAAMPWTVLCAAFARRRGRAIVAAVAGLVVGAAIRPDNALLPPWIGHAGLSQETSLGLVALLDQWSEPILEDTSLFVSIGLCLVLAGWTLWRCRQLRLETTGLNMALVAVAVAVTPGATTSSAVLLLVPLCLSLAPAPRHERNRRRAMGYVAVALLCWKPIWVGDTQMTGLLNALLLIALVIVATTPAELWQKRPAVTFAWLKKAVSPRWLVPSAGVIASALFLVVIGRMDPPRAEDGFAVPGHDERARYLILAALVAAHLVCARQLIRNTRSSEPLATHE